MKKTILIFLLGYTIQLFPQMIFSNGTGGGAWSDPLTWLGGIVPGSANNIVIAGTDSVWSESGAVCNDLSILSGGRFVTSVDTIGVNGILTLEADAWFYNRSTDPTLPGSEIIVDPQSYVVHSGSGTIGGSGNSEFGNLIVQRKEGAVPGTNLTVYGNLVIDNSAANVVLRGVRPATGSQTHTVHGDLIIKKGTLSCVDDVNPASIGIWNIKGNVHVIDNEEPYLESRIGCFSSANAAGLGIINIDGDLIIDGGRLQAGTSSTPGLGTAIINLAGSLIMNNKSGVVTNHAGPFSLNFTGPVPQYVKLDVNFNMSTTLNDTIKPGSSVIFDFDTTRWHSSVGGDFVVEGSLEIKGNSRISGLQNFYLNQNALLRIGSTYGINADSLGNIQVKGTRNYNSEASFEYTGTSLQETGNGLPAVINNMTVSNPENVLLTQDLKVNNSLKLSNGDLDLNGNTLSLGENGVLNEIPGNTVKGETGKITVTKTLTMPSLENVGGLGAVLSSGSDLGITTVERYHSARTGFNNHGIMRYYFISPAANSNLNAGLRLYYDDSELNGLPEEDLVIVRSTDAAEGSWTFAGGTVNSAENYVEITGISEFSYWTLTDKNNSITEMNENEEQIAQPAVYNLFQNYPNPFNPLTKISFSIEQPGLTELTIYNSLGEKVFTPLSKELNTGEYHVIFDGSELSSGIYFYKLKSGSYQSIRKMILMK